MKKAVLQELKDEELFTLYGGGEAAAGDVLLARYRPGIYGFFMRRIAPAEADELTQVVLEVLSRSPWRVEPLRGSFRAFAFGVARMTLRNHCGKKFRGREFDPDLHSLIAMDPSLSSQLSERNRMSWLGTAIETLPLEAQMLLDLRYGQRLNYREIAGIYEEPEPTIRRRMQALKAKLQTMRQKYERRTP